MEKLNKKLLQELEAPFHAYLLLGNTSNHLLRQAKIFGSKILFDTEEEREHPDIKVVFSENLNTLGVDDIRNVIENDGLVPIEGRYKIVIFPPVKSLTEEASNALLKTLEEPSESSIFILTSSGKFWSHARDDSFLGVLSTIKSRCRTIFIDSDIETEFNFEEKDFINFMESNKREEEDFMNLPKDLLLTLESLKDLESNSTKKAFEIQKFIKIIDEYKKESEGSSQVNIARFIIISFEYLTRNLLLTKEFGKKEFRYCELLEKSMGDIDKGMRPNIVLNNFAIASSEL
ncbi:MAG: hypothetical protein VYD43_01860 [Actinomycetota bacterium]|nr:hypothetical protein [Actinomycetota bacterium]